LDPFVTLCHDATSIQSPSSHICSVYPNTVAAHGHYFDYPQSVVDL
jgi:hypothetical protein